MKEYLLVKNKYSENIRTSFSIEIIKCDNKQRECKSDQEIDDLLSGLFFNVYTISQEVELGNPAYYGKSPFKME